MQGEDLVETPTWLAIVKVNNGKWLLTFVFNSDLLFSFYICHIFRSAINFDENIRSKVTNVSILTA